MYPPHSQPPTGGGNTFGTPQSSGMQQGVFVPPDQPEPEPVKQGLSKGTKITLIILGLLLTLVVMFAVGFAAGQMPKSNDAAGESTPDAASATHMAEGNQDTQWPTRDTTAPLRPLEPDEPEIYTQPGFDVWDPCDMPPELEQRLHLSNKSINTHFNNEVAKNCGWTVHYPDAPAGTLVIQMRAQTVDNPKNNSTLYPPREIPGLKDTGWIIYAEPQPYPCVGITRTDKGQLAVSLSRLSKDEWYSDACTPVIEATQLLTGIHG